MASRRQLTASADDMGMPRLCSAAFAGDLTAVRRYLMEGDDVQQEVAVTNQNNQQVLGVSALYLAAQNGHLEVCRELIASGAGVMQECTVPDTGERFGPADVALAHLNLRTWWLLSDARKKLLSRRASRTSSLMSDDSTIVRHLSQPLI